MQKNGKDGKKKYHFSVGGSKKNSKINTLCVSKKIQYQNEKVARKELKHQQNMGARVSSVYRCHFCKMWHLTSYEENTLTIDDVKKLFKEGVAVAPKVKLKYQRTKHRFNGETYNGTDHIINNPWNTFIPTS